LTRSTRSTRLTPSTQSPATIRPAVETDLDAMVDNTWAVAREGRWIATEVPFDREDRRRRMLDGLDDAAHCGYFVAEVDGRVVGEIGLRVAPYGVVSLGMLVIDGHRGNGLGNALLGRGIEWARTSGGHKVALEVWPHNQAALALYRHHGFKEEGRLRDHYRRGHGELWDVIVMGRPLP
jgi:RimJ/RimL family protein N-acetyltransferase